MSSSFAVADGVSIRIHHLGGTGPPLLCVHATGFHGRVWEPFVPRLRERFSIVALDQRGHGDSDKPEEDYEWPHFGSDVLAVVDELGLVDAAAIGHSAGAAALVFAETTRPGTFSRLVLMDPITLPTDAQVFMSSDDNAMSAAARKRRAVWDSTDQMIERLRKGSPLQAWTDDFLRAYVTYGTTQRDDGMFELKCPPAVEAKVYAMGGRHDGWDRLPKLTCPVLLATGKDSVVWFGDRAELAAARLAHGTHEVIDGGHFFPMENPDDTVDAVLRFLTK